MERYERFFEDFDRKAFLKWKKQNVTYRGMKSIGKDNEVWGSWGKGLYTVPLSNKAMAKQYGKVYFVVNGIPRKPKIVDTLNEAELLRQSIIYKFCKNRGEWCCMKPDFEGS